MRRWIENSSPSFTQLVICMTCCLIVGGTVGMAQMEEISVGNTFGVGARAMGMGGAFLGIADDFTALYWNPAGLAQIKKFELLGSLSHSEMDAETQFTGGDIIEADRSKTRPGSIGFVYPLYATRGGFALGLGYNRPQNFDSRIAIRGIDPSTDPVFGGLDVEQTTSDKGGIGIWSFGAGVFISKHILLGGALDFWHGTSLDELESVATDVNKIDPALARFSFHDTIDREYNGFGGRVGILAHAGDNVTLGLTAVLPMNLEIDERFRQETVAVFDDGEEEPDVDEGAILFDLERPFEFGGGIAVKLLGKRLTLAGDFQFTDWTQTEYSRPPAEDIPTDNFEQFYKRVVQIRAGAEYRIPEIETSVRLGYFRDPIPFKGKAIDNDRDFLTIGIGQIFDQVIKVDAAYMRGSWKQSGDSLSKKQTSNRVFLSVAYRY